MAEGSVGWIYSNGLSIFNIEIKSFDSNSSIIFPLVSELYEPQVSLWLLKSPMMMYG